MLNVRRAEFLARCKSIQPDLLTRSPQLVLWIFQSQAILFIFPSTFNIKPSCHINLQRNCGSAAGSHSSQNLSVAQQSNPTASLLYMWLNRKPKPFYYLNRSIQRVPREGTERAPIKPQ